MTASSSGVVSGTPGGSTTTNMDHSVSSMATPASSPSPAYHTPGSSHHSSCSVRALCGAGQSLSGSHTGQATSARQVHSLMQLPAVRFLTRPDLFTHIQNNEASTWILEVYVSFFSQYLCSQVFESYWQLLITIDVSAIVIDTVLIICFELLYETFTVFSQQLQYIPFITMNLCS